jgi:3'-5' exoribonuclease
MIIELEMLQAKLSGLPDFPDALKTLIEHLIISHHGQYDFGSPKLPMFPEALMLHYLDDLDSKMEAMRAQFERGADCDGAWTSYNPSLGRPFLNTAKFLAGKKTEVEDEAAVEVKEEVAVEVAVTVASPAAEPEASAILAHVEPAESGPEK